MGKKYVIEIEEKPYKNSRGELLWDATDFNTLHFDAFGMEKLKPYIQPDIEWIKKDAYEAGYSAAMNDKASERHFYDDSFAVEKTDHDDDFSIGDEVLIGGKKGMVVGLGRFFFGCDMQVMFAGSDAIQHVHKSTCRKTGNTYRISWIKELLGKN